MGVGYSWLLTQIDLALTVIQQTAMIASWSVDVPIKPNFLHHTPIQSNPLRNFDVSTNLSIKGHHHLARSVTSELFSETLNSPQPTNQHQSTYQVTVGLITVGYRWLPLLSYCPRLHVGLQAGRGIQSQISTTLGSSSACGHAHFGPWAPLHRDSW